MAPNSSNYDLYFSPYSICSIMVTYTMAFRGKPKNDGSGVSISKHEVDIFHAEQLEEAFLTEVNLEGQVPVLVNPGVLESPIADSLEITFYMASKFPNLIPDAHATEIRRLLTDLHAINYFSLSFSGRPGAAQHLTDTVLERLNKSDISDRYRKALEYKLEVVKRNKVKGLEPAEKESNVAKVTKLMASLAVLADARAGATGWLFGDNPTALDAHLVPFIARMGDVGRSDLIPEKLRQYGQWAMQGPEWTRMREGRSSTMVPK